MFRIGYMATSLKGHDRNRRYIVVLEDGDMVGLADGVHRGLANPKYKKKKHIQIIKDNAVADYFDSIKDDDNADELIRRILEDMKNDN